MSSLDHSPPPHHTRTTIPSAHHDYPHIPPRSARCFFFVLRSSAACSSSEVAARKGAHTVFRLWTGGRGASGYRTPPARTWHLRTHARTTSLTGGREWGRGSGKRSSGSVLEDRYHVLPRHGRARP